ncbi:MAG: putative flippase GtrA [Lentisphaeria bacterium]|jgi:putative flippase GtrA
MISLKLVKQLIIFGGIGVLATLTHYSIALACVELFAQPLLLANFIGYASAIMVSFFGHGFYTFQVKLNAIIFKKFLVVSIATFLLSEFLVFIFERFIPINHRLSLAMVVVTIPLISFSLNKLWVYKHAR